MRIRQLCVQNFRGIREMIWPIPDAGVLCLVGRGDSTKSTVLEALRRVFHPHWSLSFDDSDFFECSANNKLRIEAVLGALPDEFHDLEVYAQRMCGWNRTALTLEDDPGERLEAVLLIRLEVGADLEPIWRVVKGDSDEGYTFRASDRAKVGVNLIGNSFDRDLTWSRGSLLTRLTNGESIPALLAEAARAARTSLEQQRGEGLKRFDEVASSAEEAAKNLGVRVNSKYAANLDTDGINIRLGGLAIHDGAVPLRQLGLGSKRVLTTGLQRTGMKTPHVTLIDEIEHGLEPHRLARLIDYVKQDELGQYFITTHSPVALREFDVRDLHIIHAANGKTQVVAAAQPNIADSVQGKIRSHAESFLAPSIIVCEGATEVGFLRGWDSHWVSRGKRPFAYQGISILDANGASKVRGVAEDLAALAYSVCVLADSDEPAQFGQAEVEALSAVGVPVTLWAGAMCLEQRAFNDLPWPAVVASLNLAVEQFGELRIVDTIRSQFDGDFDRERSRWTDLPALRSALGKAAKKGNWFKSVSRGKRWADTICGSCDIDALKQTDLGVKLESIRQWVDRA